MNWNWDQPIGDPLYLPISDFNKQTYGFSFVVKYIFIRLGDVVYERYRCLYLYSVYIVNIEFLGRKVLTVDTKQCNRIQLRFYVCQITRFPAPNSGRKTRTHLLAQKHPHANTHTHTHNSDVHKYCGQSYVMVEHVCRYGEHLNVANCFDFSRTKK